MNIIRGGLSSQTPTFRQGLHDGVRPPWRDKSGGLADNPIDGILRDVKNASTKVGNAATSGVSEAISSAVRSGLTDGVEQAIVERPKTARTIVAGGVVIGLGCVAALVSVGILIGRKKS
ncbi:MAG TPA: hypothetical protein PLW14_03170 [Chlorobiota bacterium]|nr:hypothetical protein [Chlorobiota bacterium]